jgi:hypothetical protein
MEDKKAKPVDLLTRVHPLDARVRDYIMNIVRGRASEMISNFCPKYDMEELYKLIIPEEHYDVMRKASGYMEHTDSMLNFYTNTIFNDTLIKMKYHIWFGGRHPDWIFPETLNGVTPGSSLYDNLYPVLDIIHRWKTLVKLTELLFINFRPNMVMHLLPYLREVITDSLDKDYVVEYRGISLSLLEQSTPRKVPGMSPLLNRTMRDGDTLLAQGKLVNKNNKYPEGGQVVLVPQPNENFFNSNLPLHFKEFANDCNKIGIPTMMKPTILNEDQ